MSLQNYAIVIFHKRETKKTGENVISSANRAVVGMIASGRIIVVASGKIMEAPFLKYKAKRSCWSHVRGVVMNPVEHPFGDAPGRCKVGFIDAHWPG